MNSVVENAGCIPAAEGFRAETRVAAPPVRLSRAGLPRQRRLHGPRQLGDRHRGRRPLRLHADLGPADVEPDGRAAADPFGADGDRHRPRPRPGVPAGVPALRHADALGAGRGRDRRDRPGRGPRHDRRPEPALPPPAPVGVRHHGARHVPVPRPPALRRAQDGSLHPHAGRDHRRVLPDRGGPEQARVDERVRRVRPPVGCLGPLHRDRHHRRDGHAAQPLPPLRARPVAVGVQHLHREKRGLPLQPDRFGRRVERGLPRECRHPDHGGRVLLLPRHRGDRDPAGARRSWTA